MELRNPMKPLLGLLMLTISVSKVVSASTGMTADKKEQPRTVDSVIYDSCPHVNFMKNSVGIHKCTLFVYKENNEEEDLKGSTNLPACLTIRSIAQKVCLYTSLVTPMVNHDPDIKLPPNSNQFDNELKKLEPKSGNKTIFVGTLCLNIKSLLNEWSPDPVANEKAAPADSIKDRPVDDKEASPAEIEKFPYVEYMKKVLFSNKNGCKDFCLEDGNKINPLCMVYLWGYNLFKDVPARETIHEVAKSPEVIVPVTKDEPKENKAENDKSIKKPEEKDSTVVKKTHQEPLQKKDEDIDGSKIENPQGPNEADKPVDQSVKQDESIRNDQVSTHEESSIAVPPSSNDASLKVSNVQPPEKFNEDEEVASNEEHPENRLNNPEDGDDPQKEYKDTGESAALPQPQENKNQNIYTMKSDEDGSTLIYWLMLVACVGLFSVYHNKQKCFAMVLEGPSSRRRRGSRRRHTAQYRKLDCTLEEAVTSQCTSDVPHVIY